jgi:SAM-dependent methyltransferase
MSSCRACGMVWREEKYFGQPVYEPAREDDIYAGAKAEIFKRCLALLSRLFSARGRLLDIGSAYGGFLESAKKDGWTVEGVETDAQMAVVVEGKGFKVYNRPLEELALPAASYDVVTIFEVLCLMDDPLKAAQEIHRILKPGGVAYIREFNGAFHLALEGCWIFEALGLNPSVVHNFNFPAESLRRMLGRAGFKDIRIRNSRPTRGDPYGNGGWLGASLTGLAKILYYYGAQGVYFASLGRLLAGSSLIIEARK